jgi:hypothetical protein
VITVPPNTNKGNHPVVALSPYSSSTPPAYPHMLILSAVEHVVRNMICGWPLKGVG